MLNSTKHGISGAYTRLNGEKNDFLVLKHSDAVLKFHNWDFTFADYMTMCMINSVVFSSHCQFKTQDSKISCFNIPSILFVNT